MKVYIGPYKSWFGPYQLAQLLCFWTKKDKAAFNTYPDYVHNLGHFFSFGKFKIDETIAELEIEQQKSTWLYRFLVWLNEKNKRNVKIRIDKYDSWSADHTLALIILPLLKQLKETKHGAPFVDDRDVPEELQSTSAPSKENDWDIDDNHFKRWDWVLDEMIFAFDSKVNDDWQDQFYANKDLDAGGMKAYQERISNGFRLFGRYYEGLWD